MNPMHFLLVCLTVLFTGLRLTDNIDWSWWLVLAPLWGPAAVLVLALIIGAIVQLFETDEQRQRRKVSEALENMSAALRRNK